MTQGPRTFATDNGPGAVDWSIRDLLLRHKLISAGTALVVLIMVGVSLAAVLGPHGQALADSSSCQEWSSATQTAQLTYAERYLREHPNVPQSVGTTGVESAINAGCIAAFSSDEETTVTVLDAIEKHY